MKIAQEDFPFIVKKGAGFTYEWYLLAKDSSYLYPKEKPIIEVHSPYEEVTEMADTQEYDIPVRFLLPYSKENKYKNLEVSIEVKISNLSADGRLILELWQGEERILWLNAKASDFVLPTNEWQNIYITHRLIHSADCIAKKQEITCKAYFWNPTKQPIYIKNLSLALTEGNKDIYSLFQE